MKYKFTEEELRKIVYEEWDKIMNNRKWVIYGKIDLSKLIEEWFNK